MTLLRSFVTFSYYCGFVLVCIYVVVSSSDGEVVALLSHAATATVLFCVFTLITRICISSSDDDVVVLFCHVLFRVRFSSLVSAHTPTHTQTHTPFYSELGLARVSAHAPTHTHTHTHPRSTQTEGWLL